MSGTRHAIRCSILAFFLCAGSSQAQPAQELASRVSTDSLMWHLNRLSGEVAIQVQDSVLIGINNWLYNEPYTLKDRASRDREVARYFIERQLEKWGYQPFRFDAAVGSQYPISILAVLEGTTKPDEFVVLGAHYDSVPSSPGADDNGSGTVGVLEAARILAGSKPEKSVIFGFWDLEEWGLLGSEAYAYDAWTKGTNIVAAINLDMIGWNGDSRRSVLLSRTTRSAGLAAEIDALNSELALGLEVVPSSMGRSDHVSFQSAGYPSVMLIEHYGADFNPYYHSPQDLVTHIDEAFMTDIVRLTVGSMAELAGATSSVARESPIARSAEFSVYPNPARDQVTISSEGCPVLRVVDVLGRSMIAERSVCETRITLDVSAWARGVYFVGSDMRFQPLMLTN